MRSARRVLRQQAFSSSNIPNEGGRGVFAGPEPRYWRALGKVLLRLSVDRSARMLDLTDDHTRELFRAWRAQQQLQRRPSTLDRFCTTLGVDVVKRGDNEYLIKSAQAIRDIRWARRPGQLLLQLAGPLEHAGQRLQRTWRSWTRGR